MLGKGFRNYSIYFSIFICCVVTSCGRTIKLSDNDLKWNPYKGNEILIFESNRGCRLPLFSTF